jgi:hypothetical protein
MVRNAMMIFESSVEMTVRDLLMDGWVNLESQRKKEITLNKKR